MTSPAISPHAPTTFRNRESTRTGRDARVTKEGWA
jgi:hypothetical protein